MENPTSGNGQRAGLLYDFYDRRLWLTRFLSIEDSVRLTWTLLRTVCANRAGLTTEVVERLKRAVEQRIGKSLNVAEILAHGGTVDEVNFSEAIQFLTLLPVSKTQDLASLSPNELPLDLDFEIKQMLNLQTLANSLVYFVQKTLYAAVQAKWNDAQTHTHPPTDVIRRIFRCVANDIEIINRAIHQRSWEMYGDGKYRMSAQAMALLISDKLAWHALAPYQHLLHAERPVLPITFFSEYTHIHRVPYSNHLLLIGVSYDQIFLRITDAAGHAGYSGMAELVVGKDLPAFELMAIPHEVGHYVYHHAKLDGIGTFADLSKQFSGRPYHQWHEEIFADIYGCVISGPLTPLALQSLLTSTDNQQICANDGEHPPALVRPFILSEILRVLGELNPAQYPFLAVARQLNTNWRMILEIKGHRVVEGDALDGRCVIQPHDDQAVNVAEVLESVRPIIHVFAEMLLHHDQSGRSGAAIPWSGSNQADLKNYDADMARLTSREFVCQQVPDYPLLAPEQCDEHDLLQLLRGWGDSGPGGPPGGSAGTKKTSSAG